MAYGGSLGAARWLSLVAALTGCSSSAAPESGGEASGAAGGSGPSAGGPSAGASAHGGSLVIDLPSATGGGDSSSSGGGQSCATQQAEAKVERQPVDIILAIDNSGSMQDEIDAVERNINVNFANILQSSGVDYRVILISRHEKKGRETSICVSAPLSANETCSPTPDRPAFSERFFHYSRKLESLDSLVKLVETFDGTEEDEFDLAPEGWGSWLRPGAAKVFLEITDDDSTEMSAQQFVAAITAKSDQFGTASAPSFRFHSITGIVEKPEPAEPWRPEEPIQTKKCTGNSDKVENAGEVYQELSRATGGLRFPLCQYTAFDVVFDTIAKDVVTHAGLQCEVEIPPPPPGRELDLAKVAVAYDAGDGSAPQTFGQAMSAAQCVPSAFYVDAGKIRLCPETCAAAQHGKNPKLDVLFTCEETFVDPPK